MKKLFIIIFLICNPAFANIHENIINKDNNMYEYCKKQECSIEFENFYTDIQKDINELKETEDWEMEEVEPYVFQMVPNPEILYYSYNNWVGIDINDKYVYERYYKYLNKEWKSYLSIYKDNKYLEWTYGKYLTQKERNQIKHECKTHLQKYPKFSLNEHVKNTIKDIDTYVDQ